MTPNEHEVGGLGFASPAELIEAGAGTVIVTRGKEGADLHRPGSGTHHQAAFPCEVVDTTGAGDAFSGGLAWALAEGRGLEEAVAVASAVGALTTTGRGARTSPERSKALEFLASQTDADVGTSR
jgi:ribokinase